jgi:hypothetical protein
MTTTTTGMVGRLPTITWTPSRSTASIVLEENVMGRVGRLLGNGVASVILLFLLLPACAERGTPQSPTASYPDLTTYPVVGPTPDWSSPQPANTQAVSSIEEAATKLSFAPVEPSWGSAEAVYVSKDETPLEERFLFLVYGLSEKEPFWVVETAAGANWRDNFDEQVASCEPPDCSGLSVAIIRDSQRALLDAGFDVTALLWKEGDAEIRLQGPSGTFTPDIALEKANSL